MPAAEYIQTVTQQAGKKYTTSIVLVDKDGPSYEEPWDIHGKPRERQVCGMFIFMERSV